jgi:hypothetical protein
MKDYVIADGNEKEFIELAEKLGFSELVFIKGKIPNIKTKIKLTSAKNIFKSDVRKDRNLIESKKASLIYEFEQDIRKDPTHFRSSGMNHIIANLMKEKKVAYGLSFNQILSASKEDKAKLFGRILQNLSLCKKYKVSIIVGSFARSPNEMRDSKDLVAFAKTLGLNDYKP